MEHTIRAIRTYPEFVAALDEHGIIMFSGNHRLPTLTAMTASDAWHQDDEFDPWGWKDRLSASRDGVYARIFVGQGTFVSRGFYRTVYEALHDGDTDYLYKCGKATQCELRLDEMFDERHVLGRHEMRREMERQGFSKGDFEKAVRKLEGRLAITISGQVQPLSDLGRPVGWPAMEYRRPDEYLAALLDGVSERNRSQARQRLEAHIREYDPDISARTLRGYIGSD